MEDKPLIIRLKENLEQNEEYVHLSSSFKVLKGWSDLFDNLKGEDYDSSMRLINRTNSKFPIENLQNYNTKIATKLSKDLSSLEKKFEDIRNFSEKSYDGLSSYITYLKLGLENMEYNAFCDIFKEERYQNNEVVQRSLQGILPVFFATSPLFLEVQKGRILLDNKIDEFSDLCDLVDVRSNISKVGLFKPDAATRIYMQATDVEKLISKYKQN